MGTWEHVRAEREDLIAFLATLTPEQWDAQTLCSEWKVRHVVGHLVSVTDRPTKFLGPLLKAGFNFNKASANDAIHRGNDIELGPGPIELAIFARTVTQRRVDARWSYGRILLVVFGDRLVAYPLRLGPD